MIALAVAAAVPIILFPAALVWYLNIGGVVQALRAAHKEGVTQTAKQ